MWLLKPGMMKVSLRVQIASVWQFSPAVGKQNPYGKLNTAGEGIPGVEASDPGGVQKKRSFGLERDDVVQKPSYCSGLAQQRELLGARGDVTRVTWSKIQGGRWEKRASSQSFLCWGQNRRSRARAMVGEKWYKRW